MTTRSHANTAAVPLSDTSYGYVLVFRRKSAQAAYGPPAARAVMIGLKGMKFEGLCEYYARDGAQGAEYVVGLGLTHLIDREEPTYDWWMSFTKEVVAVFNDRSELYLDQQLGELAEMAGMRTDCLFCGAVQFENGSPTSVLQDADSWFVGECNDAMRPKHESQA